MREVKVAFMDDYPGFKECVLEHVQGKVSLIESEHPDFIFCSCFGHKAVYQDGIRIIFIGENFTPDFNLYDYAIGFDEIQFGDRYCRYPLYAFGYYQKEFKNALNKHNTFLEEELREKNRFCNFIVSHGRDTDMRTIFFKELCKYKTVDSCGKYLNNVGTGIGNTREDKQEFQRQCKFTLAFENSSMKGYTTEKLIEAWAAGTIPIYWGNPDIGKEFNTKAFINCHDFPDMMSVIEEIKRIDQNDDLYMEIMKTPIIREDSVAQKYVKDTYLADFLLHVLEQDRQSAYRRTSYTGRFSSDYENDMKRRWEYELPKDKVNIIQRGKQKVKKLVKG